MEFVPMKSIGKRISFRENSCFDWVATEKVHGSSYQFSTNDGHTVTSGSRRHVLKDGGSFLKVNTETFKQRYVECVKQTFDLIQTDDRWERYRQQGDIPKDDDDEEEEENEEEKTTGNCECEESTSLTEVQNGDDTDTNAKNDNSDKSKSSADGRYNIELRIYGELYGGGGIDKEIRGAIQKEILYSDDFRFYVFGITINRKWVTITELGDLCRAAGFPHFAEPITEPKKTLEDLKSWLEDSGFMRSRSRLTDKACDYKTQIEGVVMTPLTRPDFALHAVKFLSTAFTDVRMAGTRNKNQKVCYVTKARYNSVISKLDIPERQNADLVTQMYIDDVIAESGEELSNNKRKAAVRTVRMWLVKDGFLEPDERDPEKKKILAQMQKQKESEERREREEMKKKEERETIENKEGSDDEDDAPLFGMFDE